MILLSVIKFSFVVFLGLDELFEFEEFFLIFPCKNYVSFVNGFFCLMILVFGVGGAFDPVKKLGVG